MAEQTGQVIIQTARPCPGARVNLQKPDRSDLSNNNSTNNLRPPHRAGPDLQQLEHLDRNCVTLAPGQTLLYLNLKPSQVPEDDLGGHPSSTLLFLLFALLME